MTSNRVARSTSTVGGDGSVLAIAPVTVINNKDSVTIHFFFIIFLSNQYVETINCELNQKTRRRHEGGRSTEGH
jgi:hypothetical protein